MQTAPPDGWHSVTPRMFVRDVSKMVEFLKRTFDATGDCQEEVPSIIRIGDSLVMVSGAEVRGAVPAFLYVYVVDVDATYQRALAAGAKSLEKPALMPYGDRRAMVQDPWNNTWQIATRKELLR
jgi:PhnB protein